VVEDYPSIQKVYETTLASEGHVVRVASDGAEALKLVQADMPDVIVLDLLMANVGGLEFLRSFQPAQHPDTKVIVFSNLSSPELAKEVTDLGAHKYLTKAKFTPKQLAAVISEVLNSGQPA